MSGELRAETPAPGTKQCFVLSEKCLVKNNSNRKGDGKGNSKGNGKGNCKGDRKGNSRSFTSLRMTAVEEASGTVTGLVEGSGNPLFQQSGPLQNRQRTGHPPYFTPWAYARG